MGSFDFNYIILASPKKFKTTEDFFKKGFFFFFLALLVSEERVEFSKHRLCSLVIIYILAYSLVIMFLLDMYCF